MKINKLTLQYIAYRQSLGEKFKTNERYLKSFCRKIGENTDINNISIKMVNKFLYGNSPVTTGWFAKHTALKGFYQYAISRGYVKYSPLPKVLPKRPQTSDPYIYSRIELKKIFDGALLYQKNKSCIEPYMVRVILILIYSVGLRIHEALSLKLSDIDLIESVITIHQAKYYKTRLVPFNQQLSVILKKYLTWRKKNKYSENTNALLFLNKNNKQLSGDTLDGIFQRIRKVMGIKRNSPSAHQPRIHDLRHAFAVNRLTSWYQENKDVPQLLPILSTYLGHTHLAHTSVYLTMTHDLLQEAGVRFENYAKGEQL